MTLLRLILEFMKTGLFSVGGGLATLPFLYEMSDRTGWFSHADIADTGSLALPCFFISGNAFFEPLSQDEPSG